MLTIRLLADSLPSIPPVGQYSIIASLLAAIGALGRFFKYVYDKEVTRGDRLEKLLEEAHKAIQERMVPAVELGQQAVRESTQVIHDFQREQDLYRTIVRANADAQRHPKQREGPQ